MLSNYINLFTASAFFLSTNTAGTYGLNNGGIAAIKTGVTSTNKFATYNINSTLIPASINGKTPKVRVVSNYFTNTLGPASPAAVFQVGLYPLSSVAGSAGGLIMNLGTVTLNSAGTYTYAASQSQNINSAAIALPADGMYCLGVVMTNTLAANSYVSIDATLQFRYA